MQDLNDLYYFAAVVDSGGFTAAARQLRIPKSKLSRRVAQLEERYGVRLIERSARRFRVTDIGHQIYERCKAMLEEAERAEVLALSALGEPQGLVRFSCPHGLLEVLTPSLGPFLEKHPKISLQIVATDRRVEVIAERIDVALRVRFALDSDSDLSVRPLRKDRRILVTGKALARKLRGVRIDELTMSCPTLSSADDVSASTWEIHGPGGEVRRIQHTPRFSCASFATVRAMASANLGVAFLPASTVQAHIESGEIVQILPDWAEPYALIHLVFTARRGLPPAVRALIDHLVLTMG